MKKFTIFILYICYCTITLGQNDSIALKGCWLEICEGMAYENINGKMQQTNPGIKGNELRKMVLFSENKGQYYGADQHNTPIEQEEFLWNADARKFIFRESVKCPYTECSYYSITSSQKYDTLYLEQRYKNPNFITRSMYLRDRVTLKMDSMPQKSMYKKEDKYTAYNHRFIKDQIPSVMCGTYKNGVLSMRIPICKAIEKMRTSDQVELHVIDSSAETYPKVYVFIITYNALNRKINNISYVDDYRYE